MAKKKVKVKQSEVFFLQTLVSNCGSGKNQIQVENKGQNLKT